MKTCLWKGIVAAAIAWPALSGAAWAQSTDHDGCTNATLLGDYAFTAHSEVLGIVTSGPISHIFATPITLDNVAMTKFDGNGLLTQVDFVMRNGVPIDGPGQFGFDANQTGKYTVNTDCTGNFEIDFPNGVVIQVNFVLASQGREIHTVFREEVFPDGFVVAGVPCDIMAGCDLLLQAHSDGRKLGLDQANDQ